MAATLVGVLLSTACTAPSSVEPRTLEPDPTSTSVASSTSTVASIPETTSTTARSALAELVTPVGNAVYDPADRIDVSRPVSLTIESIGVDGAPVVDVGVLDNGEMEIPGRTEVGWYRFGPGPGDPGSAVLAAHIAYDNRPGVFRRLATVELGDRFTVELEDGTVRAFEVFEIAQYDKRELPFDRVFAKGGDTVVTLITCGGVFDRSLGSYEDNIVAYGRPIPD